MDKTTVQREHGHAQAHMGPGHGAGGGKPAVPGGEMALIGPKQAAELSGKSQSDGHARKGKGGKLFFRADDSGQRLIAPAGPEHGGRTIPALWIAAGLAAAGAPPS